MAKWGEGDPRWIVEEREDFKNPDQWHWEESNCFSNVKSAMEKALIGIAVKGDAGDVTITEASEIKGEASVYMRKGKKFLVYELVIKLKWKGTSKAKKEYSGELNIPELGHDDEDDFPIKMTCEDGDSDSSAMRTMFRIKGFPQMRKQVATMAGKIMESLGLKASSTTTSTTHVSKTIVNTKAKPEPKKKTSVASSEIKSSVQFRAEAKDLYDILLDQDKVSAFTQSKAKIDRKVGGEFELFGGQITGKFLELVENKKIVQLWRFKEWPAGHYSTVTIELNEDDDGTILALQQVNVPSHDIARTKSGWPRFFWDRIRGMFGFSFDIRSVA